MQRMSVEEALESLEQWDDEKLVGQLFSIPSGRHAARDVTGFGEEFGSEEERRKGHEDLKQQIRDYHVGAVIYFPPGGDHEPVENIRRTTLDLQDAAEIPLLISTDQENGTVARVRVGVTHLPGFMSLGATKDEEFWAQTASATAQQLRSVGIFQTFGPVADITIVPHNPGVNVRTAGSDANAAAKQIAVTTRGLADGGVASTLKHFPGYGSAAVDPHHGLPSVAVARDQWDRTERIPFQAGIEAGADSIMLGHVSFPDLDPENAATFSRAIVTDLLREELGFQGVIVTDAMDMGGADRPEGPAEACVSALQAGVDQLLMPRDLPEAFEAVLNALREGRLDRDQLVASARRILELKRKLRLDAAVLPELADMDHDAHRDLARQVAARSVTLRDQAHDATLPPGSKVLLIHPGTDPQKRAVNSGEVLSQVLEAEGHRVQPVVWSEEVAWEGLPETDATAAVLVLRDAWKEGLPVSEVLEELERAGLGVTVVDVRSPYEAALIDPSLPLLFTYGDNFFAIEAAGNTLVGKNQARGELPMDIKGSNGQ